MPSYKRESFLAWLLVFLLNTGVGVCLGYKFGWEAGLGAWWLFMWLYALWLGR